MFTFLLQNKSIQDEIPELNETFIVNITRIELVGGTVDGGQPTINMPGVEVAEIIIEENDDPRGVLEFNVTKVIYGQFRLLEFNVTKVIYGQFRLFESENGRSCMSNVV